MQAIWKKKEKLSPLGNEASLNFVSLRSHFNSVGRRGLSRVEMNALRAPLTTLYVSAEMEIVFSLDTADAFIDEPSKERSFTELRFASFPVQFCGT